MKILGEILKKPGIYKISCIETGKIYIGSSKNCHRRRSEHQSDLKKSRHGSIRLQNAFLKYGPGSFVFEVLEYCEQSQLLTLEQKWLDQTRSYDRDFGYNMSKSSQYGQYDITPEISQKISDRTKEGLANLTPEARARMIEASRRKGKNLGVKRTDAVRAKRSVDQKEIMKDPTRKQMASESISAFNKSRTGLPLSEQHRKKIKQAWSEKSVDQKRQYLGVRVVRSDGVVYGSMAEAAEKNNCTKANISLVIRENKKLKSGYSFQRLVEG